MLYFINPKEGWMSGLNQQFTKLSFPLNGTVGSNPTPSANDKQGRLNAVRA